MAADEYLEFKKTISYRWVQFSGSICIIGQNFLAIGETAAEIDDFSRLQFTKRRPSAILDFKNSKCQPLLCLRESNCVLVQNFTAIRRTIAELWRLNPFFKIAAFRHLGLLKTEIFNCEYGSEGQCASLWKISCWSAKSLLRYGDLSIFSKRRRSTILELLCTYSVSYTHLTLPTILRV